MSQESYYEMLDVKDEIERYLNQRVRKFTELETELNGISKIVCIENVDILSKLPIIKVQMEEISGEYLKAKKAYNTIKIIISEVSLKPDESLQAFIMFKEQVIKDGIIKPSPANIAKL